jgi:hypothetical protein
LIKLDAINGNVEWTQQIGGEGDDVGINVAIGPNDKYFKVDSNDILMLFFVESISVDLPMEILYQDQALQLKMPSWLRSIRTMEESNGRLLWH